jgi:hypothetical protein
MTIDIFIGIVSTVATFFFGSSSGSKQRENGILQAISNKKK